MSESVDRLLKLIYECPAYVECGPCRRRIGELAERAEQAEKERDELARLVADGMSHGWRLTPHSPHEPEPDYVGKMRADRDRLAAALKTYGRHHSGCPGSDDDCDCGLAEALAQASQEQTP